MPTKISPAAKTSDPRPFTYQRGQLHCDQLPLAQLAKTHGTPLYVYSATQITERTTVFAQEFAKQPHTVCYAVKANSALAILKLLSNQGAGFDIVSGGELERVLKVSKAAAQRIVFSGVGKLPEEIDAALRANILMFNVESEGELDLLAARAAKLKIRARIALRVNPDVFAETHPYISTGLSAHKFGIDIKAARAVYKRAARSKWLDPAGVSVHIVSQIRSVDPFAAALTRVVDLVRTLQRDKINIRYIDAGGGLGIEYHQANFDPAQKVHDYATALTRALGNIQTLDAKPIHLLLEPGRFIVAQAGALLARVLYIKKNGNKTFVITDAGMNDLIRPALYQAHHEILPIIQSRATKKPVDVVGPVCETGDFFARDRPLSPLRPGDLVALLDAGAYGMSLSSNYNTRPRPAEVLVTGKSARLIRRRETTRDLFTPELP